MCVITGRFEGARQTACAGCSAWTLCHTAAEANGVGCYHASIIASVGQYHTSVFSTSGIKFVSAEIHPRATAHLLVHAQLRSAAFVIHCVASIIHAVGTGDVAHVNGIASAFGNVRSPSGCGQAVASVRGADHSGRAEPEGLNGVTQCFTGIGKCRFGGCLPAEVFGGIFFVSSHFSGRIVIVGDGFVWLCIALSWRADNGSGIFEHGIEKRINKRLGEQVLCGAKQVGTLPLPAVSVVFVEASMAGPHHEMPSVKAVPDIKRTRQ